MARKVGQIIARGDGRWLIRVYLGRDHETKKRNYHNRTIHGHMREARAYLTKKLRERDLGRDSEGAKITLNEYLDRWIETAVRPRVREKTCQDYDGMLRPYVRPMLGEKVLAGMRPLELQTTYQQTYQQMIDCGLSALTIRLYLHTELGNECRAFSPAQLSMRAVVSRWAFTANTTGCTRSRLRERRLPLYLSFARTWHLQETLPPSSRNTRSPFHASIASRSASTGCSGTLSLCAAGRSLAEK
jgi:hypothetical protein